jgi:hypothetical protein
VLAAVLGGGAVHLALQACGSVKSSTADAGANDGNPFDSKLTATPPVVTEWAAYTPTLTDVANGSAIGNTTTKGSWRRVGDTIELRISTNISGTPTGSGCNDFWEWSFPTGLSPDATKSLGESTAGIGDLYQLGMGNAKLNVFIDGNGKIVAEGNQDCFLNATNPFTLGANGNVGLAAAFPITGWTATGP